MKRIGGNVEAALQTRTTAKNYIGEAVKTFATVQTLKGYLDLSSGDSKYTSYNTKLQESTHIFVCDYVTLPNVSPENSRLVIDGKKYDVLLIDDPMGLHYQLEISLKYTGG